ncbi:glycoside hydrolase family 125 protein [Kallotenue papyrolyticum]|uniref:glycoside hydrolase family 125 protein n=1 Tax=Kallotenue papyrolyticum TaxID=1325125 RepID=UPI000492CE88|nr:glycoside hydrolase family 125 protein [Kallotenue papyrolyticum]
MSSLMARRLDPRRSFKPLDLGNGALAASLLPDGRCVALGAYHPTHGWVTLSAMPPFPDVQRHAPEAVRAYRARLAAPDAPAMGLRLAAPEAAPQVWLLEGELPHMRWHSAALEVRVTSWPLWQDGQPLPAMTQRWLLRNRGDQPLVVEVRWAGACALGRAAYTQLTERGALPPLDDAVRAQWDGALLELEAPTQNVAAVVGGLPPAAPQRAEGRGCLPLELTWRLELPPRATQCFDLSYALATTPVAARDLLRAITPAQRWRSLGIALTAARQRRRALQPVPAPLRPLLQRAVAYPATCCAVPVGAGLCLLTDHMILPLSWTRDAFYVLQALVRAAPTEARDLVRRHLHWLFLIAQRPSGFWGRAYLANGQPKDQVFQLDQQCYPLLELAQYLALGGDEALVAQLRGQVAEVLAAIRAREAPDAPLVGTDETPADDPLALPYHFSSQVLWWYTCRQLDALNRCWRFSAMDLAAHAEAIRRAIWQHFVIEHASARIFAYASDLRGSAHAYHDANDLPTVLAPGWGFCAFDDPVWQATMRFAFSPANQGGFYTGPLGGLGSIHTPAPWPLGDVQALLFARATADRPALLAALRRLLASATWDGALPEARDAHTGAVRSRHWFAWPAAALLLALAQR